MYQAVNCDKEREDATRAADEEVILMNIKDDLLLPSHHRCASDTAGNGRNTCVLYFNPTHGYYLIITTVAVRS